MHGCVKYTGISLSEVMDMPVYLRKNWIATHNYMEELERKHNEEANGNKTNTISDESINNYI